MPWEHKDRGRSTAGRPFSGAWSSGQDSVLIRLATPVRIRLLLPFTGGIQMKIIAKYHALYDPPLLQLWIHDAPHRRMHIRTIQNYRKELYEAVRHTSVGRSLPIDHPIDLDVLFISPATPDLGNAYLALEQALDNSTLTKPGIVLDDSLIQRVQMAKFFPEGEKK